ncbi:hypothetical protein [Corynebacterium jeddahense]|uniref:hypothetical protein n=1 Tax=Corynebacterium jeddahense TaxID=1414719 RepID=UPI0012ECBFAA|nr:hypothetical protein [Corynebacterium jeddahense]
MNYGFVELFTLQQRLPEPLKVTRMTQESCGGVQIKFSEIHRRELAGAAKLLAVLLIPAIPAEIEDRQNQ